MDFVIPRLFTDKDYAKKIFTKAGGHGALSVALGMVNTYADGFKFTGDIESDWDRLFGEGVNQQVADGAYGVGLAQLVQAVNEPANVDDTEMTVGGVAPHKLNKEALILGIAKDQTGILGSVSVDTIKRIAQMCSNIDNNEIKRFGNDIVNKLNAWMSGYDEEQNMLGELMSQKANQYIDFKGAKKGLSNITKGNWGDFEPGQMAVFVFLNDLSKPDMDLQSCWTEGHYMTLGAGGKMNVVASRKMFSGEGQDPKWENLASYLEKWARMNPGVDRGLVDRIVDKLKNNVKDIRSSAMLETPAAQAKIAEYAAMYAEKHGKYPSKEHAIELWRRNDKDGYNAIVNQAGGIDPETLKTIYYHSSSYMVSFEPDEYRLVVKAVADPKYTIRIRNDKKTIRLDAMKKEGSHGGETDASEAIVAHSRDEMDADGDWDAFDDDDPGQETGFADIVSGSESDALSVLVRNSKDTVAKALRVLYRKIQASSTVRNAVKNDPVFASNKEFFESDPDSKVAIGKETLCALVARTLAALIGSSNAYDVSLFDADRLSMTSKDGVMVIDDYGFNDIGKQYYDKYVEEVRKPIEARNNIGAEFVDDAVANAIAYMYAPRSQHGEYRERSNLFPQVVELTKFEDKLRPIVASFADVSSGRMTVSEITDWSSFEPKVNIANLIDEVIGIAPSKMTTAYTELMKGFVMKTVGKSEKSVAKFVSDNFSSLLNAFFDDATYPSLDTLRKLLKGRKPKESMATIMFTIMNPYLDDDDPKYAAQLYLAVARVLAEQEDDSFMKPFLKPIPIEKIEGMMPFDYVSVNVDEDIEQQSAVLGDLVLNALSEMAGVDSIADMVARIKKDKDADGLNNLIRKFGTQVAMRRGESGAGTDVELVGVIDFGVDADSKVAVGGDAKADIQVSRRNVHEELGVSHADIQRNIGNLPKLGAMTGKLRVRRPRG